MSMFEDLKKPFRLTDLEWRPQRTGIGNNGEWAQVLCYVTNRAIMDRLDEVCGPENWQNRFDKGPDGGVMCGLGLKLLDEWVWKWDGAPNTDIESVKGGISAAMKRAAVQWGMGRYLYNLGTSYAIVSQNGKHSSKTPNGDWFNWDPPKMPQWALHPDDVPKNPRRIQEGKVKLSEMLESNRHLLSDAFIDSVKMSMDAVETEIGIESLYVNTKKDIKDIANAERDAEKNAEELF